MDKLEIISVNSTPPVSISSNSDSAVMLRCIYKNDDNNYVPIKIEQNSDKAASSSTSERVPVSWSSNRYNIHSITTKSPKHISPSPKTKVTNWLNRKGNWNKVSVVNAPPRFITECRKTSAILARHDFKKSYSITSDGKRSEIFSTCHQQSVTPPSSETLERHNVFHIRTNSSDLSTKQSSFEIELPQVSVANKNTANTMNNSTGGNFNIFVKNFAKIDERKEKDKNTILNQIKEEKRSIDTPLSPESLKKKELCSYLQLVNWNVVNHNEIAPIQNRRSIRVKNNLLLTEKKELERKLNGENSKAGGSNKTSVESCARKSFRELFGEDNPIAVHQKKEENSLKSDEVIVGCIPKELLEKKEDFDDCAQEFFNRENMEVAPQQEKTKKPRKPKIKGNFRLLIFILRIIINSV